jgi:hypothetical protein
MQIVITLLVVVQNTLNENLTSSQDGGYTFWKKLLQAAYTSEIVFPTCPTLRHKFIVRYPHILLQNSGDCFKN